MSDTPQTDSPDISECQFSELDKILNTYYMDRQKNPYKAHQDATAKLDEYYTNKFLECLPVPSQQTRGNTQNPDNPKYLTKFAAGYNQAIADTKQAIKQLSKEP